jgi:hypothetical protein
LFFFLFLFFYVFIIFMFKFNFFIFYIFCDYNSMKIAMDIAQSYNHTWNDLGYP